MLRVRWIAVVGVLLVAGSGCAIWRSLTNTTMGPGPTPAVEPVKTETVEAAFPQGPFSQVTIDRSTFQPTYLGKEWAAKLGARVEGGLPDLLITPKDGPTVKLANPFKIHVRSLSAGWELDCMAAWREGFPGYLLLGPGDANRAALARAPKPSLTKFVIGANLCTAESVGEVEVTIPGSGAFTSPGSAFVLVGKE